MIKSLVFLGASLIALSGAQAKTRQSGTGPALQIGGSLTTYAAHTKQKVRYTKDTSIQAKGNILFNVTGEAQNGLTYGGVAVLELDRAKSASNRISEAYTYLSSPENGSVMLGDLNGVEKTLMYTHTDVLGGVGGPGGADLSKLVNTPVGVDYNTSIAPYNDTASKIVYISPNVSGFQVGFSFAPNTEAYGRSTSSRYFDTSGNVTGGGISSTRHGMNQLAAAIAYNKAMSNDLNVGVYLAGTTAKAKASTLDRNAGFSRIHNENQWQLGTLVDYRNFQFGGTYFDKGKSYIRGDRDETNTKGYGASVGYNLAVHTNIALGYTHTDRKVVNDGKAKADITTLTVDHVVTPGLVLFTEVDYMRLKTTPDQLVLARSTGAAALTAADIHDNYPASNKSNDATSLIVGTKIRF